MAAKEVIEDIKSKLDIVDIITGDNVKLKRSGRSFTGFCPFHQNVNTPAFAAWPETGTWKCFGCGKGGDVFDFVMEKDKLSFSEALIELAHQANVELTWSAEQKQAYFERRAKEDIYKVAADYFHATLLKNQYAQHYLETRQIGQAAQPAQLGYYDGDKSKLAAALRAAGIDTKSPIAQAILKMPNDMLIFPHILRGRVIYLSTRSTTKKQHWNLDAVLVGDKQLYFNHAYSPKAERVVVVEGQADAITLALLDIPAVATCGPIDYKQLVEQLKKHKRVAIGLDNDQAGKTEGKKLAHELYPLTQIITWPNEAKDANDWLCQHNPTADDAEALLSDSPNYLHTLTQAAIPDDGQNHDEDDLREVFLAIIKLTSFDLARMRPGIAGQLGLNLETFDVLLKSTRLEVGLDEQGRQQYEIIAGRLCHRSYDRYGNGTPSPMCSFSAWIAADVLSDDGEVQERSFTIAGKLPDGTKLPKVEVEASEFSQMNWILPRWGARAVVMAGNSNKDHLRAAILTLSKEIETVHEYAHLGWREINGMWRYLSSGGAVGADGIRVKLPPDLQSYKLPTKLNGQQREAMLTSLRFMETGDHRMTIPLWAAMYLAPLSTILNPAFTIWLFGTTGSLKSTATALAMCHHGKFSYNTPPASWTGTANALERKAFLAKDSPLWIDDYTTQSTDRGMNEIHQKADQLLRDWGNRAGRSRMRADLKLRQTFYPRGLNISTAEILPPGPSITPRLFTIEAGPDMMTRGEGSLLTNAQLHESQLYPQAMAGYVLWLAERLAAMQESLLETWLKYKEAATHEGHARIPGNVAAMYIGYESGLNYALEVGVVNATEYQQHLETGWQTLVELGAMQHKDVSEKSPVELYMGALQELFAQGKIFLRHKDTPESDANIWPSNRTPVAEHIGWYDDNFWYLMPTTAYGVVFSMYRKSGSNFPDSERGIRAKLLEEGLLLAGDQITYKILGLPRVLRIYKPDTNIDMQDPSQEVGISGISGI